MLTSSSEGAADLCQFRRHQHIVREGQTPNAVFRIEEGWACRYRTLSSGRRQITALFLPGEYCEPQWVIAAKAASPIIALTSLSARRLALGHITASAPGPRDKIRDLLSATLSQHDRQSELIVALGRKTAVERVCAVLYDIFERLHGSGRASDNQCAMPLTQSDLADVVGLTPVHVNRVLKTLRSDAVVELKGKQMRVRAPHLLRQIGEATVPLKAPRATAARRRHRRGDEQESEGRVNLEDWAGV